MTTLNTTFVIYGLRLNQEGSTYRYIGLSSQPLRKRFDSHNRSAYVLNVQTPVYHWIRKYPKNIICEIIEECPEGDYAFLCEREIYWINHYRTLYGHVADKAENCLLNVSDGGDGARGVKWSEERKLEFSISRSGENHPLYGIPRSDESRLKQSESISGEKHWNYGNTWSDEYKEKQRIAHLGQPGWKTGLKFGPHSEEHRRKISESSKGRVDSEETKLKRSIALKGKKRTDESKARYAEAAKNRPQLTCPHCPKSGDSSNMKRWHFDNCKLKP